jgi:hypothetical protein
LVKYINNKVFIGVENKTITTNGRKSIRLLSRRVLNGSNLVILDLEHLPTTVGKVLPKGCSLWPAFWTIGPNWPNSGEINILEYVNTATYGACSLHTSVGCDQSKEPTNLFSGQWGSGWTKPNSDNCYIHAASQYDNSGCSIISPYKNVGAEFNTLSGRNACIYIVSDTLM